MKHALDKAADIVGSQAELAAKLGVTRAAVGQWKLPGRRIPAKHCPEIEKLTDGQVKCEELRPDVAWAYIRKNKDCCGKHKSSSSEKLYRKFRRKRA